MVKEEKKKQGWGFPGRAKKAHYFTSSTSLCGKWMYTGELEDDKHEHPDNCKTCLKKRLKMTEQLVKKELKPCRDCEDKYPIIGNDVFKNSQLYKVTCIRCGCTTNWFSGKDAKQKAIRTWNRMKRKKK